MYITDHVTGVVRVVKSWMYFDSLPVFSRNTCPLRLAPISNDELLLCLTYCIQMYTIVCNV